MRKLGNRGFAVWEILLVLLVIILLGLGGWYVYQSKHKSGTKNAAGSKSSSSSSEKKKSDSGSKTPKKVTPVAEDDPTSGWLTYSNADGVYSFKYPPTWVFASSPELCNPGLALFGSSAQYVGKCATEAFGQMSSGSTAGDSMADHNMSPVRFDSIQTTDVTVHGVAGKRHLGIAKAVPPAEDDFIMANPYEPGAKVVNYAYFTGGRTYSITYVQQPGYPDELANFDLLAGQTFQFHP